MVGDGERPCSGGITNQAESHTRRRTELRHLPLPARHAAHRLMVISHVNAGAKSSPRQQSSEIKSTAHMTSHTSCAPERAHQKALSFATELIAIVAKGGKVSKL